MAGAAALSCLANRSAFAGGNRPPNILFILADDLGYADLGVYGSTHIRTPFLDRLAAQGVRMTDAYANSPVCSPSRLALITGRYNTRFRTGLVEPFGAGPWGEAAIPKDYPTLPRRLQAAGYRTSLVGKWHLGKTPAGSPLVNGYDNFYGFTAGYSDYFTHETADGKPLLQRGDKAVKEPGYLTRLFADEAAAVIHREAAADRPFFLSLHFNAPHWPWEGPDDSNRGTKGADFDAGSLQIYASMVENLDLNIGRVLQALESAGVADNTLVVFTSDNGGERFSQVWPFRGEKGLLLEGGIRVPAIVRYPFALPAGAVSSQLAATMDWAPTILEAAGVPIKDPEALDGISLLAPLSTGREVERTLFWRFQGHRQRAARKGPWKYFQLEKDAFLFNVAVDGLERANHAETEPKIFAELKAAWQAWEKGMVTDNSIQGYCMSPDVQAASLPIGPGTNCKSD